MKLRLRFRKITKVLTISDDRKDNLTVSDLISESFQLFENEVNGEVKLSLNNKDILEDGSKLLSDHDIVSGDLVYIVAMGTEQEPKPTHEKPVLLNSATTKTESSNSHSSSSNHGNQKFVSNPGTSTSSQQPVATDTDIVEAEEPVDHDVVNQYLREPVLCREAVEGCLPSSLHEMHVRLGPETDLQALSVVLNVLMIETGFIFHTQSRHPGYIQFTYMYPGCTDITCSLTVLSTGVSATVHAKVMGNNGATRVCSLKLSQFIHNFSTGSDGCYTQLAKLSRIFKDSIANPLVHDVRIAAGLDDVFGLLALTQEIKLRVASFLDVTSLLQLSLVNREMCQLSEDHYLWRRLYLKQFGNRLDNRLSQDWKKLYIAEYRLRKERRKLMSRMTMITPPTWGPQNPFSDPSNWIPPGPGGIIGGDYDLYPNFPSGLPGVPGRVGPRPPMLPRPRYDLIGPYPDIDPGPDPLGLLPRRFGGGRGGNRNNPFGGLSGMGPRFF